ncbi:ABC-2 type transporter [Ostertagia ostertagi]
MFRLANVIGSERLSISVVIGKLQVLAIWPDKEEECKERANRICDEYANSRYAKDLQGLMKAAEKPRSLRPHHGAGLSRLISALFVRYAKDNVRNKSVMRAKGSLNVKVLSYMPIFSMDGMILTSIAYWLIGLAPTAGRFIRTVITGVLVEAMVASLGVAVCSMSPSYAVAVTITGPLLTIYSMTGGLFTNVAMLPDWIRWVQYLSWFRFGYEAFIINEWTYEKYDNISCTMTSGKVAESCEHSGAEVIENLSFRPVNLYFNWLVMILYTLAHYSIGYIALTFRVQRQR